MKPTDTIERLTKAQERQAKALEEIVNRLTTLNILMDDTQRILHNISKKGLIQ